MSTSTSSGSRRDDILKLLEPNALADSSPTSKAGRGTSEKIQPTITSSLKRALLYKSSRYHPPLTQARKMLGIGSRNGRALGTQIGRELSFNARYDPLTTSFYGNDSSKDLGVSVSESPLPNEAVSVLDMDVSGEFLLSTSYHPSGLATLIRTQSVLEAMLAERTGDSVQPDPELEFKTTSSLKFLAANEGGLRATCLGTSTDAVQHHVFDLEELDEADPEPILSFDHPTPEEMPTSLVSLPSGLLASTSGRSVYLYDMRAGKKAIASLSHHWEIALERRHSHDIIKGLHPFGTSSLLTHSGTHARIIDLKMSGSRCISNQFDSNGRSRHMRAEFSLASMLASLPGGSGALPKSLYSSLDFLEPSKCVSDVFWFGTRDVVGQWDSKATPQLETEENKLVGRGGLVQAFKVPKFEGIEQLNHPTWCISHEDKHLVLHHDVYRGAGEGYWEPSTSFASFTELNPRSKVSTAGEESKQRGARTVDLGPGLATSAPVLEHGPSGTFLFLKQSGCLGVFTAALF